MSDPVDYKSGLKLLDDKVSVLREHFDTVQVFATRHGTDGTNYYSSGSGNFCARYGQVSLWVKREEKNNEE